MMTARGAGAVIHCQTGCREDVLPAPAAGGLTQFARQGYR